MENGGLGKKKSAQKAEKDKTERATGLGRRTEGGDIEKWDQTESPEIPDRGETSEIPGLPSGDHLSYKNKPHSQW